MPPKVKVGSYSPELSAEAAFRRADADLEAYREKEARARRAHPMASLSRPLVAHPMASSSTSLPASSRPSVALSSASPSSTLRVTPPSRPARVGMPRPYHPMSGLANSWRPYIWCRCCACDWCDWFLPSYFYFSTGFGSGVWEEAC